MSVSINIFRKIERMARKGINEIRIIKYIIRSNDSRIFFAYFTFGKKNYIYNFRKTGFGSSVNNLLYVISYCQINKYGLFVLSSNWSCAYEKGWHDYFDSLYLKPFTDNKVISIERRSPLRYKIRLFSEYKSRENYTSFILSMNQILKKIWKIKPEIWKKIEKKLPKEKYVCIHIRRGDKIQAEEDIKYEVQEYINALLKLNLEINTIFLMSDDFSTYIELRKKLPNYKILTLINSGMRGFNEHTFNASSPENKKRETIALLTEIEIARRSVLFIGTFGSNIFRLIKFFKIDNCIDISGKEKFIPYL